MKPHEQAKTDMHDDEPRRADQAQGDKEYWREEQEGAKDFKVPHQVRQESHNGGEIPQPHTPGCRLGILAHSLVAGIPLRVPGIAALQKRCKPVDDGNLGQ